MTSGSTTRLLQNTFKRIQTNPVEGFCVELPDESNFFEWKIYLEGPSGTPFASGIFQLLMTFPQDYPMAPPTLRFISDFWHPNVYKDGRVCISILHPPGEDMMSGELAEERWLPTQTVETVVLSVMSMLGDPNISSPANVDASVEMRKQPDKYVSRIKALIEKANKLVPSGIKIPHPDTNPVERKAALEKQKLLNHHDDDFMMDGYDDEDYDNYGSDDYEGGSDFGEGSDEDYGSYDEASDDEEKPKEKKAEKISKDTKKASKSEATDKKEEKKEKKKDKKVKTPKTEKKTKKESDKDKKDKKTKKKSKSPKTSTEKQKVKKTKKKS